MEGRTSPHSRRVTLEPCFTGLRISSGHSPTKRADAITRNEISSQSGLIENCGGYRDPFFLLKKRDHPCEHFLTFVLHSITDNPERAGLAQVTAVVPFNTDVENDYRFIAR